MKSIFSSDTEKSTAPEFQIKPEPTYYTKETTSDEEHCDNESNYDIADTYYTQEKYRRPYTNKHKPQYQNMKQRQNFTQKLSSNSRSMPQKPTKGRHPQKNGQTTRCNICQSINHWASQCPDKNSDELSCMVHEIILQNSSDTGLQTLLSETWSSAVLDAGATSTVCGRKWFDVYLESLNADDRAKVTYEDCNKPFRFGDGKQFIASKAATIQANIGPHKVGLKTHTADTDIPLLLSKSAMKKGETELKFSTDTIIFLGDEIPLNITPSGLYHLPLTPSKQLLEKVNKNLEHHPIILRATENKSKKEIAVKLHRSFAHRPAEKLLKLINNSGQEWSENADLKKEIKEVTINCEICKRYKKAPPQPVVSLPKACQFQETVAMDLKYYQSHIFTSHRYVYTFISCNICS